MLRQSTQFVARTFFFHFDIFLPNFSFLQQFENVEIKLKKLPNEQKSSTFLKAYFCSLNKFATLTWKVIGLKQRLSSCCCYFFAPNNLHNFATANLRKL